MYSDSDVDKCDYDEDLVDFEALSEEVFESRIQEAALQKSKILDTNALTLDMMAMVQNVQDILNTTHGIARVLLQKFDWNNEQLLDEFYKYETSFEFLAINNIASSARSTIQQGECLICLENTALTGLQCSHLACFKCWKSYLKKKIDQGRSEIECMSCNLAMEDGMVMEYIRTKTAKRLKELIIQKYVTTNKQLKWCPGVDCGRVVKRFNTQTRDIKCSCGYEMCFVCGEQSHFPLDCRHLKTWTQLVAEHERNALKKKSSDVIKNCPKCNVPIQKVGGCDRMTCSICWRHFCWRCLDQCWYAKRICAGHKVLLDTEQKADRFTRHQRKYLSFKSNIVISPTFPTKLNVGEIMGLLKKSRRILMTSTIFLYFLTRKNSQTYMYKQNVMTLEKVTNDLPVLLTQETNEHNVQDEVEKKMELINRLVSNLKDIYKDGNEKGLWVFEERPSGEGGLEDRLG